MDLERVAGRKDKERLGGARKAEKLETKLLGKLLAVGKIRNRIRAVVSVPDQVICPEQPPGACPILLS